MKNKSPKFPLRYKIPILLFTLWALIALWPQGKYQPHHPSEYFISQAKDFHIPDLPKGWQFREFVADDGRKIRWGESANKDSAKATLIFVPGFGSFAEMFSEQITMMQARGYHVICFEARGMGGGERDNAAQPEQMLIGDYKIYSDDFAKFYSSIDRGQKPLLILNSSFGAHYSLRSIAEHGLDPDGVVALAPAFFVKGGGLNEWQANAVVNSLKLLGKGQRYMITQKDWAPYSEDLTFADNDCGTYPARLFRRDVILWQRPDLRTGGATVDWLNGLAKSRHNFIQTDKFLDHYKTPTRLLLADYDAFVGNDYAIDGCDKLENCQHKTLENTRHCMLAERDEVLEQILASVDELYTLAIKP